MLYLANLTYLDEHQHFLQKRGKHPNLFLVGGCIRDLLLGITKHPLDIDFTMGGNPEELYAGFNTEGLSHFITEKFGTSTFIVPLPQERLKSKSLRAQGHSAGKALSKQIHYELTPLRTEGAYGDFRHPGEIQRSNDLILDSQRRDFTVNAMYYFSLAKQMKADLDFTKEGRQLDEKNLINILEREGYCYLANLNLLIVRSEEYIQQVFGKAVFDETYFRYLVETQREGYFFEMLDATHKPLKKEGGCKPLNVKSPNKFRVLIDPTGGLTSLIHRKLETVGEANKRFGEDALRLVRALRIVNVCNHTLAAKKGIKQTLFDFTSTTRDGIQRNAHLIQYVAKERIKDELTKVFSKGDPFGFLVLLNTSGMLEILFPALAKTRSIAQPIRYHAFDIYTHTLLTLRALQEINGDYLVRFAALYHDVGKVAQYAAYDEAQGDKEKIRAIISGPLNHRNSSPELMKQDFGALGFSRKEVDTISWYILEHHTPGEILQANPDNREKKVRKLLSEKGYEMVNNLFDINIADRLGQFNPLQNSADLSDSYALKTILKKLNEEEGQFKKSDLRITGTILMKELKLAPGPLLGELLSQAFEWVINDISTRNNEKEILVYLKSYLKNRKE